MSYIVIIIFSYESAPFVKVNLSQMKGHLSKNYLGYISSILFDYENLGLPRSVQTVSTCGDITDIINYV